MHIILLPLLSLSVAVGGIIYSNIKKSEVGEAKYIAEHCKVISENVIICDDGCIHTKKHNGVELVCRK